MAGGWRERSGVWSACRCGSAVGDRTGGGWWCAGPAAPPPAEPKLVFEDDFNGRSLNLTRWRPYDSTGNAGHGLRRPSAISLDGAGYLVITASTVEGQVVSGGMAN